MMEGRTYDFRAYFWRTDYGPRNETWIYEVRGDGLVEVAPHLSYTSKDGVRGWCVWQLKPGRYIVIIVWRRSAWMPYYVVTIKELRISTDLESEWRVLHAEKVAMVDKAHIVEKARELVLHSMNGPPPP
jgi:hypothetical protein